MLSDITKIQPRAWNILSRSFKRKRLAGTYLFYGPPGVGHWYTAMSLAALVNCEQPTEVDDLSVGCGQCRSCRTIMSLGSEAVHIAVPIGPHKNQNELIDLTSEIIEQKRKQPFSILRPEASAHIPVATARDIKKKLSLKASTGTTRVVLFYHMELMKESSADALLKLIEEPPTDSILILTTGRPDNLLPTIRSRSQTIKLSRISQNVIEEILKRSDNIAPELAARSARLADGSLGRALELCLETDDDNSSVRAIGLTLFKSLMIDNPPDILANINELLGTTNRGEVVQIIGLWQSLIRDCAGFAVNKDTSLIDNIDFVEDIKKLSARFTDHRRSAHMIEAIKFTLADIKLNVHIPTALMILALKIRANPAAA